MIKKEHGLLKLEKEEWIFNHQGANKEHPAQPFFKNFNKYSSNTKKRKQPFHRPRKMLDNHVKVIILVILK